MTETEKNDLGQPVAVQPSIAAALYANQAVALTTFVLGAVLTMVPQLFLLRTGLAEKELLLSAALLTGTFAAMAGVWWSRHHAPGTRAISLGVLGMSACLLYMLGTTSVAVFLVANVVLRGVANGLVNLIDREVARAAGPEGRRVNDVAATFVRLISMLAAPLWFGYFFDALALSAALLGLWTAVALISLPRTEARLPLTPAALEPEPLRPVDRWIFGHAVLFMACMYLFGSDIIYLLRDYMHMDNPEERGALVVIQVSAMAVVAVGVRPAMRGLAGRHWIEDGRVPLMRLVIPPLLTIIGVWLHFAQWVVTFAEVMVAASLVGLAFGSYQLDLRGYVTAVDHARGGHRLLAAYNNLSNVCSLVAFGSMAALAVGANVLGFDFHRAVLLTLMVFCAGATVCGLQAARTERAHSGV